MKNRRTFLAAVASGGVGALLAAGARAAEPTAPPAGTPAPAPAKAPPSPAALATAASFRAFDPALTDADIATIARGIDANRRDAAALNPKGRGLRNADEPVLRFAAAEALP